MGSCEGTACRSVESSVKIMCIVIQFACANISLGRSYQS